MFPKFKKTYPVVHNQDVVLQSNVALETKINQKKQKTVQNQWQNLALEKSGRVP